MDGQSCPRRADGLEVFQVADGNMVYRADSDTMHHLNGSAAVIMELCDGTVAADDLPELLAEIFHLQEPPREEARRCLETLFSLGLLVTRD